MRSWAMKPITEKMTKPAKMLVALLVQVTMRVSLEKERRDDFEVCLVRGQGERCTTRTREYMPFSKRAFTAGRPCFILFARTGTTVLTRVRKAPTGLP